MVVQTRIVLENDIATRCTLHRSQCTCKIVSIWNIVGIYLVAVSISHYSCLCTTILIYSLIFYEWLLYFLPLCTSAVKIFKESMLTYCTYCWDTYSSSTSKGRFTQIQEADLLISCGMIPIWKLYISYCSIYLQWSILTKSSGYRKD